MTTNLVPPTHDRIAIARNPEWLAGVAGSNPFVLIFDKGDFHRVYDFYKTWDDITKAAESLSLEQRVNVYFEEGLLDN